MAKYQVWFAFYDFEIEDADFIVEAKNDMQAIALAGLEYEETIGNMDDVTPEIRVVRLPEGE